MAYTIQEYRRAINGRWGSDAGYRTLLHGSYRGILDIVNGNISRIPDTLKVHFHRGWIDIGPTVDGVRTVEIGRRPSRKELAHFKNSNLTYDQLIQQYRVYLQNPTPEAVARYVRRDWTVRLKVWIAYWYRWIRYPQLRPGYVPANETSANLIQLTKSFHSLGHEWHNLSKPQTWTRPCLRYLLRYIPFLYVTDYRRLERVLRWWYGPREWFLIQLRGGFHGYSLELGENKYVFNTGKHKLKFCLLSRELSRHYTGIIDWYRCPEGESKEDMGRLTWWRLFKELRQWRREASCNE